MSVILVIVAFLILIAAEILKVYFIMPFPNSQVDNTVDIAYFINTYIIYFRIIGGALLLYGLYSVWEKISLSGKIFVAIGVAFYIFVFLLFNYYFVADKIFYQPQNKIFASAADSKIDSTQLVIGVALGNEAKAYPIEVIGYHHQVRDVVGGVPVMVTYCTVCRTGRVFSPVVDGKEEQFRLVGMDHYNAMFEDKTTKSWWRQVSGEAITGERKGQQLTEIPSTQMSLRAWLEHYPATKIMQPDTTFQQGYDDLKLYDEGTLQSGLEKRDSLSWKNKSWIVGVQVGANARAYDWNDLLKVRVINDTLGGLPIAVTLADDSTTFYVFNRDSLHFNIDTGKKLLTDVNTGSAWKWNGVSIAGPLNNTRLKPVQSYQEFWHSWRTFRPHSTKYELSH